VSDSQPTNGSDKSNNKIENRAPFVAPNSTWEQGSVKEKQAAVSNCLTRKETCFILDSICSDSKVSQQQDGDKHEAGAG
jgi:hypothetical protein